MNKSEKKQKLYAQLVEKEVDVKYTISLDKMEDVARENGLDLDGIYGVEPEVVEAQFEAEEVSEAEEAEAVFEADEAEEVQMTDGSVEKFQYRYIGKNSQSIQLDDKREEIEVCRPLQTKMFTKEQVEKHVKPYINNWEKI